MKIANIFLGGGMPPDTRVYQVTSPKFLDLPLVKVGVAKAKCFLCA